MSAVLHATRRRRATLRQRTLVAGIGLGVSLLRTLPDRLVYRIGFVAGTGLSMVMPARRRLVRENLGHVCRALVSQGLASDRVRRAVSNERALDGLTRAAFGHWVLAYVEPAIALGYSPQQLADRVVTPDGAVAREALAQQAPGAAGRIFVSPHFGSLELTASYGAVIGGLRIVAPMETVAHPALQAYLEQARGASGIRIVPIRGAATLLRAALADGQGVALVADRAIGGAGVPVKLFGAMTRLPLGPAVLALESGAPVFAVGTRRTGRGAWAVRVERIEPITGGTLRQRVTAQLDAQARAFERIIADAPEQWWTCFFPIWQSRPAEPVTARPHIAEAA